MDVRGPPLKKKRVSPDTIMVSQWVSAYPKEEGTRMLVLSTWNRVNRKEFVSQNLERVRPDTRDGFLITERVRS